MCAFAVLILAYAPIGRPVQKFLRAQLTAALGPEGMMVFVLAIFLGGSISFLYVSRLWRYPPINIFFTALILLSGIGYSLLLPLPEERIHLVQFGLLGLLACPCFWMRTAGFWKWIWRPLLFVFLVGTIDEIIQWFLPDRVFDLRDILFNALGGIWGILLYLAVGRRSDREGIVCPTAKWYSRVCRRCGKR